MYYLGLIPARGGSKGLPGKNLAVLRGKPLISYTIEAALGCRRLDRVIVSTDSEDIASVARRCGAEVPFMRPSGISGDTSTALEVMCHATEFFCHHRPLTIVYLQPTSPLRTSGDIEAAIDLHELNDADTVVSVVPVPHQFGIRAQMRIEDGKIVPASTMGAEPLLRQEKEQYFARNGPALLLCRVDTVLPKGDFYHAALKVVPMKMPHERSLDIDTPWDMRMVECALDYLDEKNES